MKRKYKEFADDFEQLCEKYSAEDFDTNEVIGICIEIVQNFGE